MGKLKLRPILFFVLLSYGLAWLVALPLWLKGGLKNPLSLTILIALMGIPALAAAIVSKSTDPAAKLIESLVLNPWKPVGRTLRFCLFAVLASLAISLMALVIGSAFGVYEFDLKHFSGLNEVLKIKFVGHEAALAKLPPLWVVSVLSVVSVFPGAVFNALPALGEEIGWRGWLLPKLLPLGILPALVVSGVIWALWHTPLILLGFNYPSVSGWLGLVCMTAMCISFGSVLAWIRLRSKSVWPAALGHGAFNATPGLSVVFGFAGQKIDPTQATVLGWTGWIFPALLAVVLFFFFPRQNGSTPKL